MISSVKHFSRKYLFHLVPNIFRWVFRRTWYKMIKTMAYFPHVQSVIFVRYVRLSNISLIIISTVLKPCDSLQWRHNDHDGVSNRQSGDCLLNRLFRCISKKTSKLRVTGFCEGNSPVTGKCFHLMTSSCMDTKTPLKVMIRYHTWQFGIFSSNWNIFRVTGHLCGEF